MDRNSNQHAQSHHPPSDDLSAEVLLGRIVDGEAQPDDRARFEELAAIEPSLWRALALRQQDMAALTARFEQQTGSIEQIHLPLSPPSTTGLRLPWLVAFTGWAAVLVLGMVWGMLRAGEDRSMPRPTPVMDSPSPMSPDEHLREYLRAPFVTGELPPTLLNSEQLPDGRTMIRILRRIEEVALIDAGRDVPVDEQKRLTTPPGELRSEPGNAASKNDDNRPD